MSGETRARRRIRLAVESRGYSVVSMEWEPVYNAGEMQGWAGGWEVTLDRAYGPDLWSDDLWGLSAEEVLAYIDYLLPPDAACACDRSHDPMTAARLINDPECPTHGPDCIHHIRYRLPWWKDKHAAATP